jgi:hypothetical protein
MAHFEALFNPNQLPMMYLGLGGRGKSQEFGFEAMITE